MCQFFGISNGILGPKWENQGGAPYGGHFEFLQKVKYIWDTGAKTFQPTKN